MKSETGGKKWRLRPRVCPCVEVIPPYICHTETINYILSNTPPVCALCLSLMQCQSDRCIHYYVPSGETCHRLIRSIQNEGALMDIAS